MKLKLQDSNLIDDFRREFISGQDFKAHDVFTRGKVFCWKLDQKPLVIHSGEVLAVLLLL